MAKVRVNVHCVFRWIFNSSTYLVVVVSGARYAYRESRWDSAEGHTAEYCPELDCSKDFEGLRADHALCKGAISRQWWWFQCCIRMIGAGRSWKRDGSLFHRSPTKTDQSGWGWDTMDGRIEAARRKSRPSSVGWAARADLVSCGPRWRPILRALPRSSLE